MALLGAPRRRATSNMSAPTLDRLTPWRPSPHPRAPQSAVEQTQPMAPPPRGRHRLEDTTKPEHRASNLVVKRKGHQ